MTYFSAGAMKARYPGNFSPFCSETQYQSEVLDSTCKEKKNLINCGFRVQIILLTVKNRDSDGNQLY